MLININSQSSYWGNCDSSQPPKANPGGANTLTDGYYCSDTYVLYLNQMLNSLGLCNNLPAKRLFIGQVAHETAYFTKFYQPADGGRGALHMIPANWPYNVPDAQTLFPSSDIQAQFNSLGGVILTQPQYAWLSAAAWFKLTNRLIPNCNKDLFLGPFSETSRCVFGNTADPGYSDRQQAYNYAVQYIV